MSSLDDKSIGYELTAVRKLDIAHPRDDLPLILALSDDRGSTPSSEVDSFYSEGLQARLSTFMSNLIFWQDILEHCRSLEIKQTLIDHFQVFFLQQILYVPSCTGTHTSY